MLSVYCKNTHLLLRWDHTVPPVSAHSWTLRLCAAIAHSCLALTHLENERGGERGGGERGREVEREEERGREEGRERRERG